MKVTFTKYSVISSGEEYYALLDPMIKTIDGVKFIECTKDFKTPHYVNYSSLTKIGKIEHVFK